MANFPTQAERVAVCNMRNLRLNGLPARVTGYLNDFATVTQVASGLDAQWSWETAVRIATTHGRFES